MKPLWGLTGGIGSGKTTILGFFEKKRDVICVNTDKLAKRIMGRDEIITWIAEKFGTEVLHEGWQNGGLAIDYKALAEIVFNDGGKKCQLETLVHPLVLAEIARIREEADPEVSFVLAESAIIFETGIAEHFDGIICAYCPDRELQIERVVRRGLPLNEAIQRAEAQIDPEVAMAKSDYYIYTDRSLGCVRNQVETVYQKIKETTNG